MLKETQIERIRENLINFIQKEELLPWQSAVMKGYKIEEFGKNATGNFYKGLNAISTYMAIAINGYRNSTFLTFLEIKKRGGSLNKGASCVDIIYPYFENMDETKKKLSAQEVREKKEKGEKVYTACKGLMAYQVYNICDTNLPHEEEELEIREVSKDEKAEDIINTYKQFGPEITYVTGTGRGDGCYYPALDYIEMYPQEGYNTDANFYSTLFHEMVHSTGHESRLNRPITGKFGSPSYAKEELVAETGASILMSMTEFKEDEYMYRNAAYLKSWLKRVKSEKGFIENLYSAFNKALKAVKFITKTDEE